MSLTRRNLIGIVAGAAPALHLARASAPAGLEIPAGKFQGTRESLKSWSCPDWYRDAKFGIWAHWGPQSAAEFGDWYAKRLYQEGGPQYKYHCEKYGHPSKKGFKDVIPTWHANKFDPEHLMDLYAKAGAKYFVSMGVHHDNFDLWNSKHQRWNSVNMGPKKDIVGLFKKAATKRGMKFGVSEHLAVSYHWFQTSHKADKQGQFAGVAYDGNDKANWDLYHETHDVPMRADGKNTDDWNAKNVPDKWKLHYFQRMKDLIDNYEPDLLYTDGPIFFEEYGLSFIAHLYNTSAKTHGGKCQAVYTSKRREDSEVGTCILDLERGVVDKIWPNPWQTDTCVGQWHYKTGQKYKDGKLVIDMLVDIVSRNGNLLLNFPLPNSGALDNEELQTLDAITKWMGVNSSAIYGTRPWKVFGGGPGTAASADAGRGMNNTAGHFNENKRKTLVAEDVRYTQKGNALYAFSMGANQSEAVFAHLGTKSELKPGKIKNVELLGFKGKVAWKQEEAGLKVQVPARKPCDHALVFKVTGA